jgi:hypothetical protein
MVDSRDPDDDEDGDCEMLLEIGCEYSTVVVIAPLLAPVSMLVTVDTSPAASVVVGNSMIVILPPIPLVTTVIVRVVLVDQVDDVDPIGDMMYGNILLLLVEG